MDTTKLINCLNLFREYEEDIPIGTMICFLHLCENDGATVGQVENKFGFGKSRSSRNMRNLTDRARPGKPGINVAFYRPSPSDFRVTTFHLNEKGQELRDRLKKVLSGTTRVAG